MACDERGDPAIQDPQKGAALLHWQLFAFGPRSA